MKTIIGLRGIGGKGKTTTIGKLFKLVENNIEYKVQSSSFQKEGKDFKAIVSKNGIWIGISSGGDRYRDVYEPLQEFVNADCKICICACRTKDRLFPNGTNGAISKFTDYKPEFIGKTIVKTKIKIDEDLANQKDAKILMDRIEEILKAL